MKTKATLQPNYDLEFTIFITATVSDWKALQKQLDGLNEKNVWYCWPLSTIVAQINDVMGRLSKVYHSEADAQSPQVPEEAKQ